MKKKMDSNVWYDARTLKNEQKDILELVCNGWFKYILLSVDQYKTFKLPKKMIPVVQITSMSDHECLNKEIMVFAEDVKLLQELQALGHNVVYFIKVFDNKSMRTAQEEAKKFPYAIIELQDQTNIPLELLIATLQDTNTSILKVVGSLSDAKIALAVMEVGSDGVVLKSDNMEEISGLNTYMRQEEKGKLELVNLKVVRVQHVGRGNRACIDTIVLLNPNEGMIIGSSSRGGLLVSSETHELPYMNLRPFRVNAGALHSYTWSVNNTTEYLSDLHAGSVVLAVDTDGNTREVSVGRVKTEERPMLLIEAEYKDVKINTIVQDDWHIRLFEKGGQVVNASNIMPGDELMGYICEGGRHVGIKIKETIDEL
jgi:3-dehydroquinate synthase II/3-amino-4-hydroxybenzoic acid synthase